MRALTRTNVPVVIEGGGVELKLAEIGGGMTASFVKLPAGADLGPMLVGLTGDSCQCPHWGYILGGRMLMRTTDGEEIYEAGQAVYWAPGHVPVAIEDTDYVDFSPTAEFMPVIDHVRAGSA